MGGGAFLHAYAHGEPTLNTPRMSPEEYTRLKALALATLQEFIATGKVVALTEAPEKTDYGDIDIFVASDERVDLLELARRLGAAGVICHNIKKATFGIPKGDAVLDRPPVVYKHLHEHGSAEKTIATLTTEEYAQLDVEVVSSGLIDWYTFYSSYGDMAGLLGHIVTQLGFRVTDRGFWLRMKELDFSKTVTYVNVPDQDGMIFLSSDPVRTMRFLGVSDEKYYAGFTALDELYEWLGECRLLSAEALKVKRDNAHERNREQTRTVYSGFFKEWLPQRIDFQVEQDKEEQEEQAERLTGIREQYLQEAVGFFNKRTEYETKHDALVRTVNNGIAANLLKPIIAEHSGKQDKSLNEILRAFRRYVGFDANDRPCVLDTPHTDADSQLYRFLGSNQSSLRHEDSASAWVKGNWEELRSLARLRSKPGAA